MIKPLRRMLGSVPAAICLTAACTSGNTTTDSTSTTLADLEDELIAIAPVNPGRGDTAGNLVSTST